ncbi:dUTP diphosphatase [Romboutsia maritimum]|uniref:dUTP diphosphatase n=1 Tax=Romboutsia maritimum TaxID=2020948 RepID=A0A371ISA0_9FIRM|nr:dUTP diphosphatase [Romboutsia maritimum]RDY23333.1 dUTP diphosphatase [Romboutsia maritimum]
MIINVKKTNENATIPVFAHPTDSGFDLFTAEDVVVEAGKKAIAKTGLIFEIPTGWGIQIKNKSGITVKGVPTTSGKNADITVYEGTIDMDYRGEVGIMLKNEEEFSITIPKHTKIAQGVLRKVYHCTFNEVNEVNETVRGEGGFGSTGTTV